MKPVRSLCVAAILLLGASGCLVPPFVCPKTGAHGIVVDQDNKPLSGVELRGCHTPMRFYYMFAPSYEDTIRTDRNGRWEFYVRKAVHYGVCVLPKDGYERDPNAFELVLDGGRCPTNDFVFRLIKKESSVKELGEKPQ